MTTAQVTQLEKIYVPPLLPTTGNIPSDLEREDGKYCWYLAYGSNMCEKSFLQRRGIKPLRSLAVWTPEFQLAFNLPGLPYMEPRFANVIEVPEQEQNKDGWDETKAQPWGTGLVGVAYYVTMEDMAKILITEGGGSSYQVVQVDCEEVPNANGQGSKGGKPEIVRANTLFANNPDRLRIKAGSPSPRYMTLLRTGAREKSLPASYIEYLDSIETYKRTHVRQKLAMVLFLLVLAPVFIFNVALSKITTNKKGETPEWQKKLTSTVFSGAWKAYDLVHVIFGNGEVTESSNIV
ncbi:hypothetical protein CPB86DRAFT_872170 [Serendipita vermifera]|nr:hypothetical protein CPB86DRAFT_872170 [Serendipita vermifera]